MLKNELDKKMEEFIEQLKSEENTILHIEITKC
jgi:hypothetical protein